MYLNKIGLWPVEIKMEILQYGMFKNLKSMVFCKDIQWKFNVLNLLIPILYCSLQVLSYILGQD